MDSSVILDKASDFGDPIDLDRPFPGFPFDDEGFDQLAARHLKFADHLFEPSFYGSLRNRNRGSGNGVNNNYQGYSDEDARSQASGSSAASGTSAASSHGEPEGNLHRERSQIPQYGLRNTVDIGQHRHDMENPDKKNRSQRSMSAPPENRQTFCQQQQTPQQHQQQQQTPAPGQRYVSRIDITPQHNQPQQQQQQPQQQQQQQHYPQQSQAQTQTQPQQQQQGSVRHIPIFVEGRDQPVLTKSFDEPHYGRESSPSRTQYHPSPPHFQRSPHFAESPFGRSHQWPPSHFQDSFYPGQTGFDPSLHRQWQPTHGYQQHPRYQQQFEQPRYQQQYEQPRYQQQYEQPRHQQQYEQPRYQQQYEQPRQQQQYEQSRQPHPKPQSRQQYAQQSQPQQCNHQQQQQPQQQQEPPKPKPVVPKDPLERVALVQKEVDALAEQVKQYAGNSRKDKEYIYLDEMLTRELIKLDDIETEGRENVRQARKNAIKTIQETISLLESKAPIASSQPTSPVATEGPEDRPPFDSQAQPEAMDTDKKQEELVNEPIPLPPVPSPENNEPEAAGERKEEPAADATSSSQTNEGQPVAEPMDTDSADKSAEPSNAAMEVQQTKPSPDDGKTVDDAPKENPASTVAGENEQQTENQLPNEVPVDNDSKANVPLEEKPAAEEAAAAANADTAAADRKTTEEEASKEKLEKKAVDEKAEAAANAKQSPKTTKKGKKTKKQAAAGVTASSDPVATAAPVSGEPLPAPENTQTDAK